MIVCILTSYFNHIYKIRNITVPTTLRPFEGVHVLCLVFYHHLFCVSHKSPFYLCITVPTILRPFEGVHVLCLVFYHHLFCVSHKSPFYLCITVPTTLRPFEGVHVLCLVFFIIIYFVFPANRHFTFVSLY